MNEIEKNLFLINQKINKACEIYARKACDVELIAVSKTIEQEKILLAINAGVKNFGENYIKESSEKWPAIKQKYPEIKLHFIGHLQSNKTREAVDLFDSIASLDSKKLAQELQKEIKKQGKNPEIFIQINIGEEIQKNGILPQEANEFISFAKDECGLNVVGLMAILPANEEPSPYFALLAKIAKENGLKKLSMGMSQDFEDAIALGSTHIRIGTAIFGTRNKD